MQASAKLQVTNFYIKLTSCKLRVQPLITIYPVKLWNCKLLKFFMSWTFKLRDTKTFATYLNLNCKNSVILVPKSFILKIISTKIDYSLRKTFENKEVNKTWENWTHSSNSWSLYVIDYYFSRMITWNTLQYLKKIFQFFLVILFYFSLIGFFLVIFTFFLCNALHNVGNVFWLHFLLCCYYYSQQIISGVANKFLIAETLIL